MIFIKVLLVSSSTKQNSSTRRAVDEAEKEFRKLGIDADIFELGNSAIFSCNGCGYCKKSGKCIYNDKASELTELLENYEGFIFFTPVHYGGASGNMISLLGRIFYSQKKALDYKPASVITVSRRGGNLTAFEEITRFLTFSSMPIVTGNYPGIIHGTTYDEVSRDYEGLQTIRAICNNMAWLMASIRNADECGITRPISEEKIRTNYIAPN